jgi:hypothetical protein
MLCIPEQLHSLKSEEVELKLNKYLVHFLSGNGPQSSEEMFKCTPATEDK